MSVLADPQLSGHQLSVMVTTERVNSCISLVAIFFVIVTFTFSSSFNKPINRLIFFAGFGNVGSNIASLISSAGPLSSTNPQTISSLCQFQAFLVQMFLGVDVYWAFCMALNVYLVFFRGYTTEQLRKLDLYYLFLCYGMSLIPAVVFLFINIPSRGHMYGPAIIWCWISPRWDSMRVVFLYGIVWVAMLFAFVVYAAAVKVIWSNRRHLNGFLNPLNEAPWSNTVTTDIEITYEERFIVRDSGSQKNADTANQDPYSVNIEVGSDGPSSSHDHHLPAALRMRSLTRAAAESGPNTEAWLYARAAVLFFLALIITWGPSSANRLYGLLKPNKINFPLNYVSSLVFPLQGFWNGIVYVITSQRACRELWNRLFSRRWRNVGRVGTNLTSESDERIVSDIPLSKLPSRIIS